LEPDATQLPARAIRNRVLRERVRSLVRWEVGLAVALVAVILFGTSASDQFLTSFNFFYLNLSIGEVAIMALPLTLIIVTGEIDLSVASILGMSSALVGDLYSHGWPMPLLIVTVLFVGAAAGAFNGFLVTKVGLPSLAVTIGTLTLYRGIAVVLLGPETISNFPARYTNIGVTPLPHTGGYLSYSVGIFIVLAVVFAVVLHATPFGRSLFAMGANDEAARYAGIRVKRTKLILFVVSGVICALAGILYTFRLSTAVQDNGVGLELSVVTIVLLGGVSIFGGRGTIIGVVLAIAVFAGLQNALFLTDFEQRAMGVVTGTLLLLSVLIPNTSAFVQRGRDLLRRRELGAARAAPARQRPS
jgi:rhamnose transport system permease protein